MKSLIVLITLISGLVFGEYLVDAGYNADGVYVEELVKIPQGLNPEDFRSSYTATPTAPKTSEVRDSRVSLEGRMSEDGMGVSLVWRREFGEFAELVEPEYEWTIVQVADTGEAVIAPKPVERRGALAQVRYNFQERPVVSTLVTVGTVLGLDYLKDGEINLFGLIGGDDKKSNGGPVISINGTNNSVNFVDNNNSNNDSSNRPQTAAPFFPPQN